MSVKVEHSVVAKCKPEHAWQKFSSMVEWPWWNRAIGSARWSAGQPWQQGSRFHLEIAYPKTMALACVVSEAGAPGKVAWTCAASGLSGTMQFRFEAESDANSVITAQAEFSGLKATFGGSSLKDAMQKTFGEWLEALKTEAEKIAREEFARS